MQGRALLSVTVSDSLRLLYISHSLLVFTRIIAFCVYHHLLFLHYPCSSSTTSCTVRSRGIALDRVRILRPFFALKLGVHFPSRLVE